MSALVVCLLSLSAVPARHVPLGDESLKLTLTDEGRIGSLLMADVELLAPGQTGGLWVSDIPAREGPVALSGTVMAGDGRAVATYADQRLGLKVTAAFTPGARHTMGIAIAVEDTTKTDRGLTLEFALPLKPLGWTWWDDADTGRAVEPTGQYANLTRLRELPGLPEFDNRANLAGFGSYSALPVAAVTSDQRGLGLARPPRSAGLYRFGFDGARGVFYCAMDFALSPNTAIPGHAEFFLTLYPVVARYGYRGALAELYELWPDDFASRVPWYGGWMPFQPLSAIQDVDEFGFAYQEGGSSVQFDDALGVLSFIYFHCAGEFANIPGYTRGDPLPPYEQQLAALNASVQRATGIADLWTRTGIQRPDGTVNITAEGVYGDIFSQPCVSPALPYGKAMADSLVAVVTQTPAPEGVDGCYYDGLAVGLDYSRERFPVARHPLLWDAGLNRPVAYNFFASLDWAEHVAERLRPHGKLTMLNDSSVTSFPFVFPYIDVLGAEGGWAYSDAEALRIRSLAYHKPFCTLLKADFSRAPQARIESYMRRCLAFGHLFGFFDISPSGANPGSSYWEHPEWYDRDRELFRRYMPLVAELCRAGWEPVTLAESLTEGARLERFGGGRYGAGEGPVFFTLRRDEDSSGASTVAIVISRDVRCYCDRDVIAMDAITGETLATDGAEVTVPLPPGEVTVIAVGSREQLARRCLTRLMALGDARYQDALATPAGLGAWSAYFAGASVDSQQPRSGATCLKVSLAEATGSAGASQAVSLHQSEAEDLIIRGASRAEGVSGEPDPGYAIYVDCYYAGGGALYGQTIQFDTGTHGWQSGELRIRPAEPVAMVTVYCMLRGHTGAAWFDDISLTLADEPDRELLRDGGFESAPRPADDPCSAEARRRLNSCKDAAGELMAPGATAVDPAGLSAVADAAAANLAWIEGLTRGPDGDRALRDLRDARDLLASAVSALTGRPLATPIPQRLTPPFPLSVPRATPPAPRTLPAGAAGRVPAGTVVTVDSNFEGYGPGPLTDGAINPKTDDWTQVAWASADEPGDHWVRLDFPAEQTIAGVGIHWAWDSGAYQASAEVVIEVLRGSAEWVSFTSVRPTAGVGQTAVMLEPVKARSIRIRQPTGAGPASRPNILWISEIELF